MGPRVKFVSLIKTILFHVFFFEPFPNAKAIKQTSKIKVLGELRKTPKGTNPNIKNI